MLKLDKEQIIALTLCEVCYSELSLIEILRIKGLPTVWCCFENKYQPDFRKKKKLSHWLDVKDETLYYKWVMR